jgi:hypothetical protein
MYRILEANQEVRERRNQLRHPPYAKPQLVATAPNQVWTWDITKLLGPAKWTYYYLYVILDIYSRYVVGWMLAHRESQHLAERLIRETLVKEGILRDQLTIHSDRGPAMRSQAVAQLLATLGVTKSHSRPHVSDDSPFSESQFKTLKYRPDFPDRFATFDQGLDFCRRFFNWHNDEHCHWGIGLLTPAVVHAGQAPAAIASRASVLAAAQARHPERFVRGLPLPLTPQPRSGSTRQKTSRKSAHWSYRATVNSIRRCLKVIDTFRWINPDSYVRNLTNATRQVDGVSKRPYTIRGTERFASKPFRKARRPSNQIGGMPRRRPVRPVPPECAEHRGHGSEPGPLTRGGRIPRGGARRQRGPNPLTRRPGAAGRWPRRPPPRPRVRRRRWPRRGAEPRPAGRP